MTRRVVERPLLHTRRRAPHGVDPPDPSATQLCPHLACSVLIRWSSGLATDPPNLPRGFVLSGFHWGEFRKTFPEARYLERGMYSSECLSHGLRRAHLLERPRRGWIRAAPASGDGVYFGDLRLVSEHQSLAQMSSGVVLPERCLAAAHVAPWCCMGAARALLGPLAAAPLERSASAGGGAGEGGGGRRKAADAGLRRLLRRPLPIATGPASADLRRLPSICFDLHRPPPAAGLRRPPPTSAGLRPGAARSLPFLRRC